MRWLVWRWREHITGFDWEFENLHKGAKGELQVEELHGTETKTMCRDGTTCSSDEISYLRPNEEVVFVNDNQIFPKTPIEYLPTILGFFPFYFNSLIFIFPIFFLFFNL